MQATSAPAANYSLNNWAGVQETTNPPYTAVSASWILPAITGTTSSQAAIWVGLDGGWNGSSVSQCVEQCGFYVVNTAGTLAWSAWSELFPAFEEFWSQTAYPCASGDHVAASVSYSNATQLLSMALQNITKGWAWTVIKSLQAIAVEEDAVQLGWQRSAEVIVESPVGSLANFSTTPVTFTSITTTPAITAPSYITLVNTSTDATPGTLSGGSLTVTWNAYN